MAEARAVSSATRRPTVPALEEVMFAAVPVLDRGFVRVVDYMGDDAAVVQGARVSFGRGTRQISGDLARVTYAYDVVEINQDSETWVREGGHWHEDDC